MLDEPVEAARKAIRFWKKRGPSGLRRSAIYRTPDIKLSGQLREKIMGTESLDRLKNEIAEQSRKELRDENLKAVYITEVLIQNPVNGIPGVRAAQ